MAVGGQSLVEQILDQNLYVLGTQALREQNRCNPLAYGASSPVEETSVSSYTDKCIITNFWSSQLG